MSANLFGFQGVKPGNLWYNSRSAAIVPHGIAVGFAPKGGRLAAILTMVDLLVPATQPLICQLYHICTADAVQHLLSQYTVICMIWMG